MKKTFIFGRGSVALLVKAFIDEEPNNFLFGGYIIDDDFFNNQDESINWSRFVLQEDPRECQIIIGIGYKNMNSDRRIVYEKIVRAGFDVCNFIHKTASISKTAFLGKGNLLFPGTVIEPYANIGNGNIFWSNSTFCHHSSAGDFNFFACSSIVLGRTTINNNCFFGANSTIKNRIEVASYSFIGANTFLHENTNEYDVYLQSKSYKINKKSTDLNI